MKEYQGKFTEAKRQQSEENPECRTWSDFWDSDRCHELQDIGYLKDIRHMAFTFPTDGVSAFDVESFEIWPMILLNLNLP